MEKCKCPNIFRTQGIIISILDINIKVKPRINLINNLFSKMMPREVTTAIKINLGHLK